MTADPNQHQFGDGSDPILGKVIDGCKIQRKLGQGGMGVVYLAEHEQLHQPFVIKILNPALVGAEDTVERFFREAQACAQLNHTGIVAIQNVGQEGEYYFIRMEYIEGKTLEDTIKEKNQFDWRHATQVIIDTGDALSHAHQKGMIHRDIKPENIMLTPQGAVKVMDFGLAKHVHSQAKVSVTGQIVGTPFFMSPEQAGGKPTDARSDIYSLGVTLYYMLTGVKPFNGKNLQEIFLKHFFYAPESPKIYNPELPEALCEVVKKCLKKKKKERYQSAKELTKDLRTVLEDPDARIVADAASESQVGEPPEGGGAAPGSDFGQTIRSAEKGDAAPEEGGKTMVAQADRTMVSGGLSGTVRVREDVSEGTVRVQDGDNGQTVRVGAASGSDVTVNVRDKPGGGATVKVNEDEEHPAAGLDLPTQVINQLGLDTGGIKIKDSGGAVAVTVDRKKLAIVACVLAVPLLLLGANEMRAKGKLSKLQARYDAIDTSAANLSKLDPRLLLELADEMADAPAGMTVTGDAYAEMEKTLRGLAKTISDQRLADQKERERKAAQAEKDRQAAAVLNEQNKIVAERLAKLSQLELDGKYKDYAEEALLLIKEFPDVPATSSILLPVRVGSEPPDAEVYLVGEDKKTENLQGRTPTVIKVKPNREFVLKIRKAGFKETVLNGDASMYVPPMEADLTRQIMREPELPRIQVQVGTRARPEELTIVSPVAVDAAAGGGGVIYMITHDGMLRAYNLKRAASDWREDRKEQLVGMYGDCAPSPTVVPGQVVLASSLLGTITAHRPGNDGQRIWTVDVGCEVTSPAAFGNAGGGQVVAAGLSNGEVVFIVAGREHWRFRTENMVTTRPFLQGQRAFFGSGDDKLYAVDFGQRVLLGSLDLGADVVAGPRAIGRNLVCATGDGRLHVVDTTNPSVMTRVGEPLGEEAELRTNQGIEVEADRIYHAAGKQVRAYSVTGGAAKEVWSKPFECGAYVTRPVVAGDVIYVGASNGVVYAIDRATGVRRWSHPLPGASITLPPFVVDQEVFVITGGKLVVLQTDY